MALALKDDMYLLCRDWARRQQEYQGYTNYVTWLIAYEINNDEHLSETWGRDAEEALREAFGMDSADPSRPKAVNALMYKLRDAYYNSLEVQQDGQNTNLGQSLLLWTLDSINWYEIADELVTKAIERAIEAMSEGAIEP